MSNSAVTPQKTTLQNYVDRFADWPASTQQQVLGELSAIHRQTCRREDREQKERELKAAGDKKGDGNDATGQLPLGDVKVDASA